MINKEKTIQSPRETLGFLSVTSLCGYSSGLKHGLHFPKVSAVQRGADEMILSNIFTSWWYLFRNLTLKWISELVSIVFVN